MPPQVEQEVGKMAFGQSQTLGWKVATMTCLEHEISCRLFWVVAEDLLAEVMVGARKVVGQVPFRSLVALHFDRTVFCFLHSGFQHSLEVEGVINWVVEIGLEAEAVPVLGEGA